MIKRPDALTTSINDFCDAALTLLGFKKLVEKIKENRNTLLEKIDAHEASQKADASTTFTLQ